MQARSSESAQSNRAARSETNGMNDWIRAARRLVKKPAFSAVVVLTLAFGIGANATVWCWLDQLVWRPLPGVARQHELVVLVSNQGGGGVSQLDLRDLADLEDVFAGAVLSQMTFASLEVDGQPEWVNTQIVSADYFDVLGVRPLLGRTFLRDEDQKPGGDTVLVISERLWRRRFAADPGVVGRVVELNRHPFTIVGVVAAPFRGTMSAFAFDAWAPSSMIWEVRNQRLEGRSARGWHNLTRLRPGVSLARARAAVAARDAQLAQAYPDTNRGIRHRVLPLVGVPVRRAGRDGTGAAPAAGGEPRRPADRGGERRQPVAGLGRRPSQGDRDPALARGRPRPARPLAARREPAAGARGRPAGDAARDSGDEAPSRSSCRRRRPASCSTSPLDGRRARLHAAADARHGPRHRARDGDARDAGRASREPEGRRPLVRGRGAPARCAAAWSSPRWRWRSCC